MNPFNPEPYQLAKRRGDGRYPYLSDEGVFLPDGTPLLRRTRYGDWEPRPLLTLAKALACHTDDLEVLALRCDRIAGIADYLNKGNVVVAIISLLHLQLRGSPAPEATWLAKAFNEIDDIAWLDKASPDDEDHPGWPKDTPYSLGGKYRPTDGSPPTPSERWKAKNLAVISEESKAVETTNKKAAFASARQFVAKIVEIGVTVTAPEISAAVHAGELAVEAYPYVKAYFDDPKTLGELQNAVKTPETGYDIHHIVERATGAPDGSEAGKINGPDNLVRIPTMKHWELNGWYDTGNEDYGGMTPREYLKGKSWEERRRIGLDGLREKGVLKDD